VDRADIEVAQVADRDIPPAEGDNRAAEEAVAGSLPSTQDLVDLDIAK
jgi:hypothetical protein